MKTYATVALALVVIGAINWGLVGLLGLNLVNAVVGTGMLERIVYVLVGLAGLWLAWEKWGGAGSKKR